MSTLSLYEAQGYVAGLKRFPLKSVGSEEWMAQHDRLEQLNLAAHRHAQTKHDEFVVSAIQQHDQLPLLVHELLVIEAWKNSVLPLLAPKLGEHASLKAYLVVYHEATILGLLEILLFHEESCETNNDEALIELADYCYRKNTQLLGKYRDDSDDDYEEEESKEESEIPRSIQQARDLDFSLQMSCLTLARYMSQHVKALPLSVMVRLLDTHDIVLMLVPLLEHKPWERSQVITRGKKTIRVNEVYTQQKWIERKDEDRFQLTQMEAQVWLTLYNLLIEPVCRQRYRWDSVRKMTVTRLKRFFNDVLLAQMPMLVQLRRLVEELTVVEPPPPAGNSFAIVEQIPELRSGILYLADFQALANGALKTFFSNDPAARAKELTRLAETYNMDNFEELLPDPLCAKCGEPATNRCSGCQNEWYCSRKCQLASWKVHKPTCELLKADAKKRAQERAAQQVAVPVEIKKAQEKPAKKSALIETVTEDDILAAKIETKQPVTSTTEEVLLEPTAKKADPLLASILGKQSTSTSASAEPLVMTTEQKAPTRVLIEEIED